MQPKGYETSSRLVSIRETSINKDIQDRLGLKPKSKAVEVIRVRYLNRAPVSVDRSFFPLEVGRKLFSKDLSGDIFPMLENQLGVSLGRAEISLEARPADAEIASFLEIELGDPIMWVERLTLDSSEKPIDFEYLAFRGDSYKYRFQIERDPLKHQAKEED